MAYSGGAAHTHGWQKRRQRSAADLAGVRETTELCKKSGLPVNIVSGGSTGTYKHRSRERIDRARAGSYVFMDTGCAQVGSKSGDPVYTDFANALTIFITATARHHSNLVTTGYGKSQREAYRQGERQTMAPGSQSGRRVRRPRMESGDPGPELKLGDRVEIVCTNLDTSTNNFDRYYVAEGDRIVDVWPILGRSRAAQR